MPLPPFNDAGDLPPGIYRATLSEVLQRFGDGSHQREVVGERLRRIYHIAKSTGVLVRFIVYGSFITDKPDPADVDVMLVMDNAFDGDSLNAEQAILFDHSAADAHLGASIFWVRRLGALGGEQSLVEYWQAKRGGGQRGIVEIVESVDD